MIRWAVASSKAAEAFPISRQLFVRPVCLQQEQTRFLCDVCPSTSLPVSAAVSVISTQLVNMELCFATSATLTFSSFRLVSTCSRPIHLSRRHRTRPICSAGGASPPPAGESSEENEKTPNEEHDIPQTTVDWNSEWTKFKDGGMRTMAPQGREPVSKEELLASRAAGTFRSVQNKLPTRQQLFRDWRFWVAIIAGLSLFSAFVQGSQNIGTGGYGTI